MRLRRHQELALDALGRAWSEGRRRAWVELPPGAGKTLVGLETGSRWVADGVVDAVVVLSPNTAIQQQWVRQAREHGLDAAADRDLAATLTSLTYQSVAVFDPDAEVGDDAADQPLSAQLHPNGRALLTSLAERGELLLVLDECHHLLEVWGRLLAEVLTLLPRARVLGLTATPPSTMTSTQATLVQELFGGVVFETSIPAVVREGDLAPFMELAWLTEPTVTESAWLAEQGARFHDLVHRLTDPAFGSVPFLTWLDGRFLDERVPWPELVAREPALCRAALRLHHRGLLALPEGARLTEATRQDPTADDWVVLVDDWARGHLVASGDPADAEVAEALKRALPSVGYQWTRRGIRRGRSPVDRVLARSESKAGAAVEILDLEHRALGDRMRMLVLCDHERATATLPADLTGVLRREAGSALALLEQLVADPVTRGLRPLLVTGSTVAAEPAVLHDLLARIRAEDPGLAARLEVEAVGAGLGSLGGAWSSRQWVPAVTAYFGGGGSQVLVGTRALLGEGWDAPCVSGLVDLTAATTATSVVQMRGRSLRRDPGWPDKVAVTWSVVCVADGHPKGDNDWQRLVRKHDGFFAIDAEGEVVDGVAHLDDTFSPYAPPPAAAFAEANRRAAARAADRARAAMLWRVGESYDDHVARTVRVEPDRPERWGSSEEPPTVRVGPDGPETRTRPLLASAVTAGALSGAAAASAAAGASPVLALGSVALAAVVTGVAALREVGRGRGLLAEGSRPPSLRQVGNAVADGLQAAGLTSVGAEGVTVRPDPDGVYRCWLDGAGEQESRLFAEALDEALGPVGDQRYVVPRWVVVGADVSATRALRAAAGRLRPDGEVWHPVPAMLGANARRAQGYARAWQHWVGGGEALYTGSPEGAGVLAAQAGADPFAVTSVMRRHWT